MYSTLSYTSTVAVTYTSAPIDFGYFYPTQADNKKIKEKFKDIGDAVVCDEMKKMYDINVLQLCKSFDSVILGQYYMSPPYCDPSQCGATTNAIMYYLFTNFQSSIYLDRSIDEITGVINENVNEFSAFSIHFPDGFGRYLDGRMIKYTGHAFTIIYLGRDKFLVAQSYVGKYRLKDSTDKVKLIYDRNEILALLDFIHKINLNGTMDKDDSKTWSTLSGVDSSHLIGCMFSTKFFGHYLLCDKNKN